VEGETDKMFLESVLKIKRPELKIIIQDCQGDIAKRLNYWSGSLGDLQLSPYRKRTVVIYDKVKQSGIEKAIATANLPESACIQWEGNGIEYVYPASLISEIYKKANLTVDDLVIKNDDVTFNGISYKKMDLCRKICSGLTSETVFPQELIDKLIEPLKGI
jgi:hypothetical protein